MSLEQRVLQLFVSGVTNGSIYALLGLGLVLVYSTTRVVNVAIGDFATLCALAAATLVTRGWGLLPAVAAGALLAAAAAALAYRVAIHPARRRGADPVTLMIITIALHLALQGTAQALWGTQPYTLPALSPGPPVHVLLAVVDRQKLWVLAVSFAIVTLLALFFNRTTAGRALRACAVNPTAARLTGIPVHRMGLAAFALGAVLAAVSGALIAPITLATYDMGLMLGLKGFVGAVIGGLVNYPLTVAGCILLGLLESFAAGFLASGYRDAVAFVVLIAVLMARALPLLRHGVMVSEEAAKE
ncbi:MAG: branched-chain amino acid ABC transporter permease [Firmicutes bacterium]|nr:branched-chain amino acid ABC transporter permease [Bacillota bacterium]